MIATEAFAPFEVKEVRGRTFTGLASSWDVDHGGDRIIPGAYARTLADWRRTGRIIPLIDQHNYGSVTNVVGKMISARETSRGLEATFQFLSGKEGERYAERVRGGYVNGLSIGYRATRDRPPSEEEKSAGIRRVLLDVELKEVSLVIWGMNPYALIYSGSVKRWQDDPKRLQRERVLRDLQARHFADMSARLDSIKRDETVRALTLRTLGIAA